MTTSRGDGHVVCSRLRFRGIAVLVTAIALLAPPVLLITAWPAGAETTGGVNEPRHTTALTRLAPSSAPKPSRGKGWSRHVMTDA